MGQIGKARKVDPEEAIDTTARRGRAEASANATQYADARNWRDSRAEADIAYEAGGNFEKYSYKEMHDSAERDGPYSYTRKKDGQLERDLKRAENRDLKRHAGNRGKR